MRTVQMKLGDRLLAQVDRAARRRKTSRSAFTRDALEAMLKRLKTEEDERKVAEAYRKHPVRKGEFDWDESILAWGDE